MPNMDDRTIHAAKLPIQSKEIIIKGVNDIDPGMIG